MNTGKRRLPLEHRKKEIANRVTLAGIDCDVITASNKGTHKSLVI